MSIGIFSVAFALGFAALYLVARVLRKGGAWLNREEGPKERMVATCVLMGVVGFLAGSLFQSLFDQHIHPCINDGKPVVKCLFKLSG